MERYRNTGGDSGVAAFELGDNYIKIRFNGHKTYTYTYASAGQRHIENMKILARKGNGLNSYINNYVKYKYQSKS